MDQQTNLTITISIDEYIGLRRSIGNGLWATISEETRQTIVNQPGWEQEVFIEEIEGSPVFKLWRLKDWQWNRQATQGKVIKLELDRAKVDEAKDKHNRFQAWKRDAKVKLYKLVSANKIKAEQVDGFISRALKPGRESDLVLRVKLGLPQDLWYYITGGKPTDFESGLGQQNESLETLE